MRRHATSPNYPLYLGLLLSAFFIGVAIFGPSLAPIDPLQRFHEVIFENGQTYIPTRNPLPPFTLDQFPLGTDNAGRDLLSRLLHAIRPTLLLCTFIVAVRMGAGLVLGLLAGWYGGMVERIIDALISASLSIPILLFALAAISFLGDEALFNFIIGLSLTGWASTAVFVKSNTLTILQAPYIEGGRAVGVRPFGLLRRYVLPQLWPALPALIAFELSAVLLLVAELGFLGLFIGDPYTIMAESANTTGLYAIGLTAGYPELAQMLSDFWSKMIRTPWEMIILGLTVFLQIFAFNMLGEGLRRAMDVTRPRRSRLRQWWEQRREPETA
jgi:ABC-type dipeptide/oligopeptide/nickel transport system permease subunit